MARKTKKPAPAAPVKFQPAWDFSDAVHALTPRQAVRQFRFTASVVVPEHGLGTASDAVEQIRTVGSFEIQSAVEIFPGDPDYIDAWND